MADDDLTLQMIAADIAAAAVDPGSIRDPARAEEIARLAADNANAVTLLMMGVMCAAADFVRTFADPDREAAEVQASGTLLTAAAFVIRSMKERMGLPYSPARVAINAYVQAHGIGRAPWGEQMTGSPATTEPILNPVRYIQLESMLIELHGIAETLRDGFQAAGEHHTAPEEREAFLEALTAMGLVIARAGALIAAGGGAP